ncbi:MAG: hypothetical protein OHK0029_10410 [Armatimonadaceae bacterium]
MNGANVRRQRFWGQGLAFLTAAIFVFLQAGRANAGTTTKAPAPPVRPIVLVFAADNMVAGGVRGANTGDGLTLTERNYNAAKAVRDRLQDSNAVTGTLFDLESPLFLRAAQEAKITLGGKDPLTDEDRIKIARAAGAVYIVMIGVQSRNREADEWEIVLSGVDVESGKRYTDRAPYQGLGVVPVQDANAIARNPLGSSSNSLVNAANTLSVRLLVGPLGDYGKAAPPPQLLPPAAKPVPLPVPETDPEAEKEAANAAYQQGVQLVEQGETDSAIVALREAINRHPLDGRLRLLLTRAYIQARRGQEATSEARRALLLTPPQTDAERQQSSRSLQQAIALTGDRNIARTTYEQIIAAAPQSPEIHWARLELANLLHTEGRDDQAAVQYRTVLRQNRDNKAAVMGLAKVLAQDGDFIEALGEIAPQTVDGKPADPALRHAAAVTLFETASLELAQLMEANRAAWKSGQLSREIFYNATRAQAGRTQALMAMLKSAPPTTAPNTPETRRHARRLLAASLLVQAGAALLDYLETGDEDAGAQSTLCLLEFRRELNAAQATGTPSGSPK